MRFYFNFFIITVLTFTLLSCGNNNSPKKNGFSIETSLKKNVISLNDTLNLSIKNPNGIVISSVDYQISGIPVTKDAILKDQKLGIQTLSATVNFENASETISTKITIVNNKAPKIYTYKIINEYPHEITSYTQGLEFYNGELYESTGQYGESKLLKVDYKTADVLQNVNLAAQYFGEGLTILDKKIYQLTWRENTGFVYDVETFEKLSSFTYAQSKEGWGLCNDGKTIYKSDGTENIWTLNNDNLTEASKLQVYTNKGKIGALNELEWIDGKIYANIYQRNGVVMINPKNGAVDGVVDFSPLHNLVTQHRGLDVLNGIAYNPETKTLFITGKRWDKLFEVELIEK